MSKILQQHFKRKRLPSLHFPELNLLKHIKGSTLHNAERRLNRILGKDETVEIVDILIDVLNKSGKQQIAAKMKLTMLLKTVVPDEVSDGNVWHSNGDVEDLEEAFPYEHSENEINKDDHNEEEFFPHKFINNEIRR